MGIIGLFSDGVSFAIGAMLVAAAFIAGVAFIAAVLRLTDRNDEGDWR